MAEIKNWSAVAGENSEAAPDGWPEGMARSDVNDSAREVMAALRADYAAGEWINVYSTTGDSWTASDASSTTILLVPDDAQVTDLSSTGENRFPAGSRAKFSGGASAQYGFIVSSSFSTPNTILTIVTDDAAALDSATNTVEIIRLRDALEKTAYYPTGTTTGQTPPQIPTIDDLGDGALLDMGTGNGFDADTVDGLHAADLISTAAAAGRNVVINGGFDVWQRGTTIDSSTTAGRIYTNDHGNYTADRWKLLSGNGTGDTNGMVNVSRDTSSRPQGVYASMKLTSQLAYTTNDMFGVVQILEARDSSALILSNSVSMGVYLQGSGTLLNARFMLLGWTGTADDPTLADDPVTNWSTPGGTISLGTNWTLIADSGQTSIDANWIRYTMEDQDISSFGSVTNIAVLIYADTAFATGNSLGIAGVRVERGSVASAFQNSDYATELTRCQRYFLTTFEEDEDARQQAGIDQAITGLLTNAAADQSMIQWIFPVTMRTAPTMTAWNPINASASQVWAQRNAADHDISLWTETLSTKRVLYHGASIVSSQNTLLFVSLTADAEF